MLCVASSIGGKLWCPIAYVGLGLPDDPAVGTWVLMPKTSVHEDDFFPGRKDEIRASWKVGSM